MRDPIFQHLVNEEIEKRRLRSLIVEARDLLTFVRDAGLIVAQYRIDQYQKWMEQAEDIKEEDDE